jgi:hypothetical protein
MALNSRRLVRRGYPIRRINMTDTHDFGSRDSGISVLAGLREQLL